MFTFKVIRVPLHVGEIGQVRKFLIHLKFSLKHFVLYFLLYLKIIFPDQFWLSALSVRLVGRSSLSIYRENRLRKRDKEKMTDLAAKIEQERLKFAEKTTAEAKATGAEAQISDYSKNKKYDLAYEARNNPLCKVEREFYEELERVSSSLSIFLNLPAVTLARDSAMEFIGNSREGN